MKYTKAVIAALTSATLLSACAADPEPAPQVPGPSQTGSSQAFLDQFKDAVTGAPAPTQRPVSSWQDLLVPPVLDPKDHHK